MENYKEILEYLIELKKTKKDPNKFERDQFAQAWLRLVSDEGYSSSADLYLFGGYTYCGAEPFFAFMKKSDAPEEILKSFFEGKQFGESCTATVSILFHLFSLLVSEKKQRLDLIISIIRKIPSSLKNKEGKPYGQAPRAFKKYILDELQNPAFPTVESLENSGLRKAFIKDFFMSIDSIMGGMEISKYSKRCQDNANYLNAWIQSAEDNKTVSDEEIHEKPNAQFILNRDDSSDTLDNSLPTQADVVSVDSSPNETHETGSLGSSEGEIQTVAILKSELESTKSELECAKKEIASLKRLVDSLQQQLNESREKYTLQVDMMQSKNEHIQLLESRILDLKRLSDSQAANSVKIQKNFDDRIKLAEALSRDKIKQAEEAEKRLSSKLRIEYKDFCDAIALPMDCDLGENMRDQLRGVFDILKKAGIALD